MSDHTTRKGDQFSDISKVWNHIENHIKIQAKKSSTGVFLSKFDFCKMGQPLGESKYQVSLLKIKFSLTKQLVMLTIPESVYERTLFAHVCGIALTQ